MNVIEILELNGIPFDQKEQDNIYIDCEQCGKQNLSINAFSGAYHCWSMCCESVKGHITDLFKCDFTPSKAPPKVYTFTDIQRAAVINGPNHKTEVIEWAVSRSLDPDFVLKQGVGYDPEKKAIIFPYHDEKGNLIGARYRSTFYSTQWVVGREPDLYVLDRADLKKEKIIMVEGEVDGLTIKQMGLPCVAILGSRKDNGYSMLRKAKSIYLGYDMDGAGEAGAEKAASILGRYRCKRTKWTQKDPNDMLKCGATKEDFVQCLAESETMHTDPSSFSVAKAYEEFIEQKKQLKAKRISWGYKRLDQYTKGGIIPGWVIYLLARGNAGKTTFLLNLMMNAVEQGIPVAMGSYEEDPISEITPKIIAMIAGRNPGSGEFYPEEIEAAQPTLKMIHLSDGKRTREHFIEWVKECYYVHGVRFIVCDYLQLLADNQSQQSLLDSCYAVGKDLTKELNGLTIVWAVQPKLLQKQMDRKTNEKITAQIDGSDARGGSVIEQACDCMIVMEPVKSQADLTQYQFTKVRGQMLIEKRDWIGCLEQLVYNHRNLRLVEAENLSYGY